MARLAVGTNGFALTAASGESTGLKWAGKGLMGYDEFRRTAGSYTVNSATWTDLDTGSDLDFTGVLVGDVVQIEFWGVLGTENTAGDFDVATIVSAAPVNFFGSGEPTTSTGSGIWSWTRAASTVLKPFGGAASLVVQSGDLTAGALKLRIRCRGGSITLFGTTLDQFFWSARVFRV